MPRPRSCGFTLLELLFVIAIVGVACGFAVPALGEAIARHRLRAATVNLLDTLRKARSTAVWRGHETRVCASSDGRTCLPSPDWTRGWVARDMRNGDILAVTPRLDGKLAGIRRPGREEIDFAASGMSAGDNQTIVLCVRGRSATAVAVIIGNAGLPRRQPAAADDAARCARGPSRRR